MNLTFDILAAAWNKVKTGSAPRLQNQVPGLTNLSAIVVQRIAEDDESFTVIFRGFDKALDDINNSPLLKRIIIQWLQKFATIQIERGDTQTLIVHIQKNGKSISMESKQQIKRKIPIRESVNITRIISEKEGK